MQGVWERGANPFMFAYVSIHKQLTYIILANVGPPKYLKNWKADSITDVAIVHARALRSEDVSEWLKNAIEERGAPQYRRSDNDSKFIAKVMHQWLAANQITTIYFDRGGPGKTGSWTASTVDCATSPRLAAGPSPTGDLDHGRLHKDRSARAIAVRPSRPNRAWQDW